MPLRISRAPQTFLETAGLDQKPFMYSIYRIEIELMYFVM